MKAAPSFSCPRPGFPAGLEVLVLEGDVECRCRLEKQLKELSYSVTLCSTPDEAECHLASGGAMFEVLLSEAKAMAPESEVGSRLRLAASALPLVLMVDKDSPYRDVMRGIELGAVDVLEKPLSSLKLRNIWQHVVRKRMCSTELYTPAVDVLKGKGSSAPASPRTPSPAASQLTHGSDVTALPPAKGDEASFSGLNGQRKESSALELADLIGESVATADSAPHGKAPAAAGKGARPADAGRAPPPPAGAQKKLRRSARASEAAAAASRLQQQSARCAPASVAAPAPAPPAWTPTAPPVGGCVWGTPAVGLGGVPAVFGYASGGMSSYGSGPSLVSIDPLMQRCGSMVSNASTLDCALERSSFDSSFSSFDDSGLDLGSLDAELGCCDFPLDDALLPPNDPLFGFDAGLSPSCCGPACAPPLPGVCAPIGLKLRKSASLLDLINSQLGGGPRQVPAGGV